MWPHLPGWVAAAAGSGSSSSGSKDGLACVDFDLVPSDLVTPGAFDYMRQVRLSVRVCVCV